ncbi:MAG: hypothetical protein NVS2B7_31450 [Herpetosiphon sp.]
MAKKTRMAMAQVTALSQQTQRDANFFQGLADPTRLAILELVLDQERNVSDIVATIGGSQSRISNHLACLRYCGYVSTRREGLYIYYEVSDPRVRDLLRLGQTIAQDHEQGLLTCLRLAQPTKDAVFPPELRDDDLGDAKLSMVGGSRADNA